MSRILFGTIVSVILIGISYFTSRIYSAGFRFTGITTKASFLAFLIIPLLFAVSIIMVRSASWDIGPVFYTIIQILAGIGFYLFIGAIVLGIIMLGAALFHTKVSILISGVVLTLSFLAAIIGFIQSRFIKVTDYTVILKNAPESWNDKTAILVTDTHFGLVNYTKFSNKVVNKILSLHPDFVLHAGDFYDGPAIDTTPITSSWKKLTAAIPVFYAPGNHEGYGDYKGFVQSVRDAGVTVLDDKKTEYEGIQIAGITYRDGKENTEATAAIQSLELDSSKATILINHPPTSLPAAAAAGIDLQVSGHTHNGQFWPNTYLVRRVYGIYYYGLKKYENMSVIISNGVGTFGPPLRLLNPPELVRIHFKVK